MGRLVSQELEVESLNGNKMSDGIANTANQDSSGNHAGYLKCWIPPVQHGHRRGGEQRAKITRDMSRELQLSGYSDEDLALRSRDSADAMERELMVNELLRRNFGAVARWCLRFTSDRETAADLSQEILTKAYLSLNNFQGGSKFSTWLFTIARNHCLNAARAESRQATGLRAEVDDDFIGDIPDRSAMPDARLEQESDAALVAQMLNQGLDETERTVFTLHYGEDLPMDAITRLLGLDNRSGAKAYLVSAKRKLARLVQRRRASAEGGVR
jgi:RNA polymerase sigma-70 factor (ECF subfamily)